MNRVVEILAPAGSMECLRAAIAAGADADIPWRYQIWGKGICTESFGRRYGAGN